jgi:hypothetical protein
MNILRTFSLQVRLEKFVAHYVLATSVESVAFLEATTERRSLKDFQMFQYVGSSLLCAETILYIFW